MKKRRWRELFRKPQYLVYYTIVGRGSWDLSMRTDNRQRATDYYYRLANLKQEIRVQLRTAK